MNKSNSIESIIFQFDFILEWNSYEMRNGFQAYKWRIICGYSHNYQINRSQISRKGSAFWVMAFLLKTSNKYFFVWRLIRLMTEFEQNNCTKFLSIFHFSSYFQIRIKFKYFENIFISKYLFSKTNVLKVSK